MSSNKYLIPPRSTLLHTKLERIAIKLQGSLGSSELQTKEAYILEAIKTLGEFYTTLTEPSFNPDIIRQDDLPDEDIYNETWEMILDDLIVIFTELENLESLTLSNFNYVATEANRLTARLKSVSSKLGDFILYSLNPSKDSIFFKDSFNDLSKVDFQSSLLNKDQLELNQVEGIVTLPVDRDRDSTIVIKAPPLVNPSSNGQLGNNHEIGASFNGDLAVILDNNPDTWVEYEKVVDLTEDAVNKEKLVLDLTVNLGTERVINHVRVNPNNFGTKTVIFIDTIETSLDGEVYISIKDDIPIAGFTTEDEENVFSLAPSTSKFAGQGLYTFTPRKAKYIHIVFHQYEPYIISTSTGDKLRYAIGLRDIDIRGFYYKKVGELVSTTFDSVDEVRKVALEANQNPSEPSELASIKYFVSPDDGATWHQLQPKDFPGISGLVSTPEVIEFNGVSPTTKTTPVPVYSLRVKVVMERDDEQFQEGSSTFYKTIVSTSEVQQVPTSSPFSVQLQHAPLDGTVVVVDPLFGSRGDERSPYVVSNPTQQGDVVLFNFPFLTLPRPITKVFANGKWHLEPMAASDWVHVAVNGEEYSHIDRRWPDYLPGHRGKLFHINVNEGRLAFDSRKSKQLKSSDVVTMWFDDEQLFPGSEENNHIAKLDFTTSTTKTDIKLTRYDEEEEAVEVLARKATVLHLANENLTDISTLEDKLTTVVTDGGLGLNTRKDLQNGKDELTVTGDWSMDEDKGIIYLREPTPDNRDITVTYLYQPRHLLDEIEWDFGTTAVLKDSVIIQDSAWKTIAVENEEVLVTSGVNVLDLSKLSTIKGTLSLSLTVDDVAMELTDPLYPFAREVPFVDGVQELGRTIVMTREKLPPLGDLGGYGEFVLRENISTDTTNHVVSFTDRVLFKTKKAFSASPANLTTVGDYAIDRDATSITYGTTRVFLSGDDIRTGYVTYFYVNSVFQETGVYSVDYKHGRIYTQRSLDPEGDEDWALTVDYEYIDIRAVYRIARLLDPKSYDVNVTDAIITLKDNEILKRASIPHGNMQVGQLPYYLVNYEYVSETREDIEGLKDLFSPVLKDYMIKVLTKGRIF